MKYLLILSILFLPGCFTRTVYVPAGKSVMLRKTVKNWPIWAKDAEGKKVPGKLNLMEGWMIVPKPKKE